MEGEHSDLQILVPEEEPPMESSESIYINLFDQPKTNNQYETPTSVGDLTDISNEQVSEVLCTECIYSSVPAVKSCLLCEASLCDIHLKLHSKSREHVLTAPLKTFGKTTEQMCSLHSEAVKFYCFEDATCICMSCCLTGVHKKHRIEPLYEASNKKKEEFHNVLEKLTLQQKDTDVRLQNLQSQKRVVKEKANNLSVRVRDLFWDVRRQLDVLEVKVLSDINEEEERVSHPISLLINKLEEQKDELSRNIRLIEELHNFSDPLTVLRRTGKTQADLWYPKSRQSIMSDSGNLDERLVMVTLQKSFDDLMTHFKKRWCWASDLIADVDTAANNIYLSGDRRTISWTKIKQRRQKTPARFKRFQVMSTQSFSSGQHYWEVETGPSGSWIVGVCYPSIDRKGNNAFIGNSNKAWGLGCVDKNFKVMHNQTESYLPDKLTYNRIGIYLDYEAGQVSFYEVSDHIRHIHTITTNFTEPLHAVFWVWLNWVRVNG